MQALTLVLFSLLFPTWVRATSRFRRPPGPGYVHDYRDNPIHVRGDYLDIGWDMDSSSAKLVLWQEYDTSKPLDYIILQENTTDDKYKWKISDEGFTNPNWSNIYYLELVEAGKAIASWDVSCHYFNLTDPVTVTTVTNNTTNSTESEPIKKEALSNGTALGIGIEATLGALLVFGVVFWLIFRCLRNRKVDGRAQYMVQPVSTGCGPPFEEQGYDAQHIVSPTALTEWTLQTSQLSPNGQHLYEVQGNYTDGRHEMYTEPVRDQSAKSRVDIVNRAL